MQRQDHPLLSPSLGAHKTLSSFHFGQPGTGLKIYIQASLHAEELPGMLAAYHLRPLLERLDAAGQIQGEIVLVPMANPIGAAQRLLHKPMGRFEFDTSENFNRNYPDFATHIAQEVLPRMGPDAQANVAVVRQAMQQYLHRWTPRTELHSLRRTLLQLACDADYVLDLHCDCESVMHFYCEESCWEALAPLAHHLQSQAILLAKNSGSHPFDECLSGVWWRLAETLAAQGKIGLCPRPATAPPSSCAAKPRYSTIWPPRTLKRLRRFCAGWACCAMRRPRPRLRLCARLRRWQAPKPCTPTRQAWWFLLQNRART